MATGPDFANSEWFMPYLKTSDSRKTADNETSVKTSLTQPFFDRYYVTRYFCDVNDVPSNDLCVMQHSNKVCVIGLAAGHHIFRYCLPPANKKLKPENTALAEPGKREAHEVLFVDFQKPKLVGVENAAVMPYSTECSVSGSPPVAVEYAILYFVASPVAFTKLIPRLAAADDGGGGGSTVSFELNERLLTSHATHPPLRLTAFGHPSTTEDPRCEANSSYLCVLMPTFSRLRTSEATDAPTIPSDSTEDNTVIRINSKGLLDSGMDWETYRAFRKL